MNTKPHQYQRGIKLKPSNEMHLRVPGWTTSRFRFGNCKEWPGFIHGNCSKVVQQSGLGSRHRRPYLLGSRWSFVDPIWNHSCRTKELSAGAPVDQIPELLATQGVCTLGSGTTTVPPTQFGNCITKPMMWCHTFSIVGHHRSFQILSETNMAQCRRYPDYT